MRGPAGTPGLRLSARILIINLLSVTAGKAEEQMDNAAGALLREALTVSHCLPLLLSISKYLIYKAAANAQTLSRGLHRCQPLLQWTQYVFEPTGINNRQAGGALLSHAQMLLIGAQTYQIQHCDIHACHHIAARDENLCLSFLSSGQCVTCMQCGYASGDTFRALDDQLMCCVALQTCARCTLPP